MDTKQTLLVLTLLYTTNLISLSDAQFCNEKFDLVLIVDSSGSIRDNNPEDESFDNWQLVKEFLTSIAQAFPIGEDAVKIGAVTFSQDARVSFPLLNTEEEISDGIENLPYLMSFTNTSGGLRWMLEIYTGENHDEIYNTRSDARDVVLLITDGFSNVDKERTVPDAVRAHDADIEIYTIGVTSLVNETEVKLMSSLPQIENETYWLLPDFQSLPSVVSMISQRLCEGNEELLEITTAYVGGNGVPTQPGSQSAATSILPQRFPSTINNGVPTTTQAPTSSTANNGNGQRSTSRLSTRLTSDYVTQVPRQLSSTSTGSDHSQTNVGQPTSTSGYSSTQTSTQSTPIPQSAQLSNQSPQPNALSTQPSTPSSQPSDHISTSTTSTPSTHSTTSTQSATSTQSTTSTQRSQSSTQRTTTIEQGAEIPSTELSNQTDPDQTPVVLLIEGVKPESLSLTEESDFLISISFTSFFAAFFLIVLVILLCCCCCCQLGCCPGACGGFAGQKGFCADSCACCSVPVHCGKCCTIFCCGCGASCLTWLFCCCCWLGGGYGYGYHGNDGCCFCCLGGGSVAKRKRGKSVSPSTEDIVSRSSYGYHEEWGSHHNIGVPSKNGNTNIFITDHSKTRKYSSSSDSSFNDIRVAGPTVVEVCEVCEKVPCVCRQRESTSVHIQTDSTEDTPRRTRQRTGPIGQPRSHPAPTTSLVPVHTQHIVPVIAAPCQCSQHTPYMQPAHYAVCNGLGSCDLDSGCSNSCHYGGLGHCYTVSSGYHSGHSIPCSGHHCDQYSGCTKCNTSSYGNSCTLCSRPAPSRGSNYSTYEVPSPSVQSPGSIAQIDRISNPGTHVTYNMNANDIEYPVHKSQRRSFKASSKYSREHGSRESRNKKFHVSQMHTYS